jgi:hypothetical protein
MSKTAETHVMNELKRESVRIREQKIVKIRVAVEAEVYGAHKINAAKRKQFQARLDHTEIDDRNSITDNLEREIYGITEAQQHLFKRICSKRMAEFETLWEQHSIHELQKAIEHQIVHFGYPKMHLVSHISESIRRMGSGDNFTTDISELLHISNVKDGYRSSNEVNYT